MDMIHPGATHRKQNSNKNSPENKPHLMKQNLIIKLQHRYELLLLPTEYILSFLTHVL